VAIIPVTEPIQLMPTDCSLDNFVAHKISSLTACGAPELAIESGWLNTFILNSMIRGLDGERRAYAFNLIRLTEGAFSAYRDARLALSEYVSTPRNTISPYFRSLLYFEVCLSQFRQGSDLIRAALKEASGAAAEPKLFETGDDSVMDRIYRVHDDFKHMEQRIEQRSIPKDATSAVWITNEGLESARCPSGLSFIELVEELHARGQLAGKLSRFEPG
jgi:hypothetical protein